MFKVCLKLAKISLIFVFPSIMFASISKANMTKSQFEAAAKREFSKSHKDYKSLFSADREFIANYDFPNSKPLNKDFPWQKFNPIFQSAKYLNAVFEYAYAECGEMPFDWDGKACGWYHAPWMHNSREYLRGVTSERSSRVGELHPNQTRRKANYAVSLYNDVGGYSFGQVWKDPARPKTSSFAFLDGAVSVKLLFTTASVEDAPYLRYAKEWKIEIENKIQSVRLLQLDFAIRDKRVNEYTGWVFGTFIYNGAIELPTRCSPTPVCEEIRWKDRMVPVGLQWGNDPSLGPTAYKKGARPTEAWLNPDVRRMFETIRTVSGHPPFLGRYDRLNGPVDNPQSACLACHGRAVDFGWAVPNALQYIPFAPHWKASDMAVAHYFRNLKTDEPFVRNTKSIDYSLQAAIGLRQFRIWVANQKISSELEAETRDINPFEPDNYSSIIDYLQSRSVDFSKNSISNPGSIMSTIHAIERATARKDEFGASPFVRDE